MRVEISVTEEDIKRIVMEKLGAMLNKNIAEKDVQFLVMSKKNYHVNEWENGRFKVEVHFDSNLE